MTRIALIVVFITSFLTGQVMAAPKMTPFDPVRHGFKFSNTFTNDFVPALDVRTSGLCGGMSYAVMDYYNKNMTIPAQDYRPANRTTLQSFLYNRQVDAIKTSLDKWAEYSFNHNGARNAEFFLWGLNGSPGGRIAELRSFIDRGVPVILGLQGAAGRSGSHYVVAIGYDMGRYQGDMGAYKGEFKIFVYDPNKPNRTTTLIPDFAAQVWRRADEPASGWQSYFVVKNYSSKTPPSISNPVYPGDGKIYELQLNFATGNDDLRGGNDNVNVLVILHDGAQQSYSNVNLSSRWLSHYEETISVRLTKPVMKSQIKDILIYTNFGGGVSGDNWDMTMVRIRALGGGLDINPMATSGFFRFTGQANELFIPVSSKPATPSGSINTIEMTFYTGKDDLRGGNDNVNITVAYSDGASQTFSNVNCSSRWADNTSKTVKLNLSRTVPPALLKTITLSTTFKGGIGGDNWNMDWCSARAIGTGVNKEVAKYGYKRFTGSDKVLTLTCTP